MKIERAETIEGWMDKPELEWLAGQAEDGGVIIEVGCAFGRSMAALSDNLPSGRIYAVDMWRDFDYSNGDRAAESFFTNHYNAIMVGRVVPLALNSAAASRLLATWGVRADLIFIDANHSYESVKADIENFLPLVKPGGLLAGHDYDNANWPDVKKAVDELLPRAIVPAGHIWAVQP